DPDATIPTECLVFEGCYGCSDSSACNYGGEEITVNDGTCDYSCWGCMDMFGCNYDDDATIEMPEGVCDYSCAGCTDTNACNYDADATIDDGSCDYSLPCLGCMEADACNFNPVATIPAECEYTSCVGCTEEGACNFDPNSIYNNDCDYETCAGCTDADACNYDATATIEDDSCTYECVGCTDTTACNYEGATIEDDSCDYSCWGCMNDVACNFDVTATMEMPEDVCDLSCWGCTSPAACNYNPDAYNPCEDNTGAFDETGSPDATIMVMVMNDNGTPDDDTDDFEEEVEVTNPTYNPNYGAEIGDGIPDCCDFNCVGCMNPTACDYDPDALIEGDCTDWLSCVGCLDETVTYENGLTTNNTNYDENYTQTTYGDGAIDDQGTIDPNDDVFLAGITVECTPLLSECGMCADGTLDCFNEDGIGCTDWFAVNYDANATVHDPTMCLYFTPGCMDSNACNFNAVATSPIDYDGLTIECLYVDGICESCAVDETGSPDEFIMVMNDNGTPEDDTDDFEEEVANPDYNSNYGVQLTDGSGSVVDNDSDDDTVCDADDQCPDADDLADFDNDGIANACDACPSDDTNNTGMPNWWSMDTDGNQIVVTECYDETGSPDATIMVMVMNDNGTPDDDTDDFEEEVEVTNPDYNDNYGNVADCNLEDYCMDCVAICDDADIMGCMDATAFNFDASATWDDGSCYEVIFGCTDPDAFNTGISNPPNPFIDANTDDGSCIDVVVGCMDDGNQEWSATPGYAACNYNELANTEGDCDVATWGCTEWIYDNYNSDACYDDGTCSGLIDCYEGETLYTISYVSTLDNTITITNSDLSGNVVVFTADWGIAENGSMTDCWPTEDCYTIEVGGNTTAVAWNIEAGAVGSEEVVADNTNPNSFGWCMYGCMDTVNCNYDNTVNMSDSEACGIAGCTDTEACNFEIDATCNPDDACIYPVDACTDCDGNDLGGQDCAGVCGGDSVLDDCGTCDNDPDNDGVLGCMNIDACNYNADATCDDPDNPCQLATDWYLDVDGDGSGNSCSADYVDAEGSVESCDAPSCDLAEWPNCQYVDNDDNYDGDEIMSDGSVAQHWCGAPGIEEDLLNGLVIYPNPASDVLNIEFTSTLNQNVTIEFVNAIGQVISSSNYVVTNGLLDVELGLSEYSKGIYQINLVSDNTVVSKTIVIE
ncbi:MAG: hypothetical protein CMP49_01580, partial [Flavobacteriales bacterium]|nr:hypothetical protein [Flavobacteriales bacterium]